MAHDVLQLGVAKFSEDVYGVGMAIDVATLP